MQELQETLQKTLEETIDGVEFKSLVSHGDDRGFFREIIRDSDPFFTGGFKQWSHSSMAKNTVKAWHYHHLQTDWWYIGLGLIQVVLIDNREDSPTKGKKLDFKLCGQDENQGLQAVVKIPPGVLHGCKVLSDSAHLFYITSEEYDSSDEGRIPFNALDIHKWGDERLLIVADNDKKAFVPKAELKK